MNIFDLTPRYAEKWQVTNERAFSKEEIDSVESAKVVDSQYGLSVCFLMRSGGMTYIPLDQNSDKVTGDSVKLEEASLLTLSKRGEADIYRVHC